MEAVECVKCVLWPTRPCLQVRREDADEHCRMLAGSCMMRQVRRAMVAL
jgi:hypothetical protein